MNIFNLFETRDLEIFEPHSLAFVYSEQYNIPLQEHVFPGNKFRKIYELLCLDKQYSELSFFEPNKAEVEHLNLVHTKEYLEDLFHYRSTEKTKYSELPLNPKILDCFLYAVGGTILATELTGQYKTVFNIGGGFHHSFSDHAEGFCYLNDIAIASEIYRLKNPYHKILILDLDVHQGNGNAKIFENQENIFTFSIHSDSIYPKKEISNIDISISDNIKDDKYLQILKKGLADIRLKFKPDLVYYLAGADIYENDSLGNFKISMNGIKQRDSIVKKFISDCDSKLVVLTAGGYAKSFMDTVFIHLQTANVFGSSK
jgi:acetoin utilization deacetylase AcuC-like enzyme